MKNINVNEKQALYEAKANLLDYLKLRIEDEYRWHINEEAATEEDKASARCRIAAYEQIANEI